MKTHLSTTPNIQRPAFKALSPYEGQKVKEAFRLLLTKFSEVPEIGKFKPIRVTINNITKNRYFKNATISIEPSVKADDFRTRVLTFSTKSVHNKDLTYETSPASGNKFSIESTLKNPRLIKMFQAFVEAIDNAV